ncbi:hypothetical protein [Rhodococcus sp. Leaf278]|uniref:hypothetical protein n=1 Tax=Rhodococcus sp. Leaf278 TaxID=1736319 RepID=UPI000AD14850|nr:hypothetical protein [Rhodococcus sp. Leaf278]
MITWTVTTHPEDNPEILTATGAEPNLECAKLAAADAVRIALLDAREHASSDNGTPPSYLVTLDGNLCPHHRTRKLQARELQRRPRQPRAVRRHRTTAPSLYLTHTSEITTNPG